MRVFTFHLEGDYDWMPAVEWVTVRDEARALELAAKRLRDMRHLRAIEVYDDAAQFLCRLDREAPPPQLRAAAAG